MATSSLALSAAGLINPTKPATYPVILGEDIRANSSDPTTRTFTGIRYNFKPRHLTDKSTQRKTTLTAAGGSADGDFDVTFRDNSGGRYVYAGSRVSKGSKYVLVFDSKRRQFILHRLDSLFVMNMTDTPTNHDTDALKKKHPHIDETTKRPRPPRGAAQLVRRPAVKKSAGPLRPMQKPVARPSPKPTVLRSSHDIKKKEKRVMLAVPEQDPDRETKAARDVREQREAIIVKDARDSRDARDKAAVSMSAKDGSSSSSAKAKALPGSAPPGSSPRDARDAALQKSKAAALSARPKEGSKLSKETKPSPDAKPRDRDDFKSRSIDVKSKDVKASPLAAKDGGGRPKAADAKARLPDKPRSDDKAARPAKDKDGKAREKEPPRDGKERAKDGGKSITAKGAAKAAGSTGKAKTATAAPLSLPMPEAPPPAPAPKKKRRDWEDDEDEEDDDDDGDIGLVIEYPTGPAQAARGSHSSLGSGGSGASGGGGSGGARGASSSTPQLHMPTFDEFQRANEDVEEEAGGDDGDDLDGYWDPREDEKKAKAAAAAAAAAAAPAVTQAGSAKDRSKAASAASGRADDNQNDIDELEEALNKELLEEEARKRQEAELEAELEAEFMAESESEISEEE